MTSTLSELFQEAKGEPITFSGRLVHGIYKREVKANTIFTIKILSHSEEIVQGVHIKGAKGKFEVNGQLYPEIILWTDTCPAEIPIKFSSKSDETVKFWNVWRNKNTTHAWIGNAGLCINEEENKILLECSDGIGDVNFNDLVVEIKFSET
ncbi:MULTISPECIES: hypothetical protein [unclassified Methylobacter]|jgi:hypothetical protein|uniref:hypothetical protein n=1 Tax=unclassified Methylobacter TaxID=2635283 RepID=UPI001894E189|nr:MULTISPECIES: hypothetical protein [unclassified Methylobacter]MBF6651214.1 hypothetical protein [Methylobacter sp. BlB1]WAK04498.1 hypothetical protein LZ558_21185 [Methylobacter sp. YRD-M1]